MAQQEITKETSAGRTLLYLAVAAVGLASLYVIARDTGDAAEKLPTEYRSEEYGLSFAYPENYFIKEYHETGERTRHTIVLMEDTPGNRDIADGKVVGTESPPTITITLFQNNLDNMSARSFVEGTSFSNFKLSDGTTVETMVGGAPALRYHATGLYENENAVVARPAWVYMFTGFYLNENDPIRTHFEELLTTVRFDDASNVPNSAENAPPGSIHNLPVPKAVAAVRSFAAKEAKVTEGEAIVMSAYEREWPDACLGLQLADMMCAQVITPGYEITVSVKGKESAYRTNADGTVILPTSLSN